MEELTCLWWDTNKNIKDKFTLYWISPYIYMQYNVVQWHISYVIEIFSD